MTIGINGKQMTLPKASTFLEEPNRSYREKVYLKIHQRVLQDTAHLEELFDQLLEKRHQIANNAGFENFRDYKFQQLGRFDYTVEDCFNFHSSIATEIRPILDDLNAYRKRKLGLEALRPWDLNVDIYHKAPLRPFDGVEELVEKTIKCLSNMHPYFGEAIRKMQSIGHLDLASRKGKHLGGYNMPLPKTGVPFIFMNATRSFGDLRTFMHESGHAVHALLSDNHRLAFSKQLPSEIAELAAMTMELLSMDHWHIFFEKEDDLRRAKIMQLENVLKVLPWIATIDKFQHWIYTNPNHNHEDRKIEWRTIMREFSSREVDQEGLENMLTTYGINNCTYLKSPFTISNMGWRSSELSPFGKLTGKIHKKLLSAISKR